MEIAVYKYDGKVLKTTNLEKKRKKLGDIEVLYSRYFSGNNKEAEAILDTWITENMSSVKEDVEDSVKLHYFRISDVAGGGWVVSIYGRLEDMGLDIEAEEMSKDEYDKWVMSNEHEF